MQEHSQTPNKSLCNGKSKDKHFQNQFRITFDAFYKEPLTMKEVSVKTGIDRANICRYCRTMRKAGMIAVVKKSLCTITRHWANRYTTNRDLFPTSKQLKIF